MSYNRIDSAALTQMFLTGTRFLGDEKETVNALNVYPVPDGDTGTNMSLTMSSAVQELQKKTFSTCAEVSKSVAKGSLMGARGNSGVILSQIFRGFSKGCEGKESLTVPEFAHALREASDMAYRAVLKPVEGTILTVIRETADAAVTVAEEGMLFHHFFKLIIAHARKALDKTPELLAVLKQAGVVDAGGKGLLLILQGFEAVAAGESAAAAPMEAPAPVPEKPVMAQPEHADIRFAYCTEFIIRAKSHPDTSFRTFLEEAGDSLVFVTDEDLVKVHVHTNNPGTVLERALLIGELVNIKIENMKEQHHNILSEAHPAASAPATTIKPFGFIAVAAGGGIGKIFRDLGADVVIEGGQTMNPSTEDILKGVDQIAADCIFVLPNNSNIILAANQAKALSDRHVVVLPSKSVPQGIAAMVQFNPDHDDRENEARMGQAMKAVSTLQVTYSVRDTQMGERDIRKGDSLGILDGEIVASGTDCSGVIQEALDAAVTEDSEILTLYYGEAVTDEEAESLSAVLEERYPHLEIEVYNGGQPVYSHLFSIE